MAMRSWQDYGAKRSRSPRRKHKKPSQFKARDKVLYYRRGKPVLAEVVRDYAARMVSIHYWYTDEKGVVCHHWVYTTEDKLEKRA